MQSSFATTTPTARTSFLYTCIMSVHSQTQRFALLHSFKVGPTTEITGLEVPVKTMEMSWDHLQYIPPSHLIALFSQKSNRIRNNITWETFWMSYTLILIQHLVRLWNLKMLFSGLLQINPLSLQGFSMTQGKTQRFCQGSELPTCPWTCIKWMFVRNKQKTCMMYGKFEWHWVRLWGFMVWRASRLQDCLKSCKSTRAVNGACFHCIARAGLWTAWQNVATNAQSLATSYTDLTVLQQRVALNQICSFCFHIILILPLRIVSCEWNLQLDLFVVCGSSLLTQCKEGALGWQFRQWSHHPQSTLAKRTATNPDESTLHALWLQWPVSAMAFREFEPWLSTQFMSCSMFPLTEVSYMNVGTPSLRRLHWDIFSLQP